MSVSMEQLESLLDKKFEEFKHGAFASIKEAIDGLQASMTFFSQQYDDLARTVNDLEKKNKTLSMENSTLKAQIASINGKLAEHQAAIDEAEQYSRRECLEIRGIPVTDEEDTSEIVTNIASLLDVEIRREDISISHRLKVKNSTNKTNPPPIIAKFLRREERDDLYQARNKLKYFTTKDLEGDLGRIADNKIYISESLTRKNKELFNGALKFKKEFHFKFIWSFYGRIFLRKDTKSPSIVISSQKDLEDLKSKCGR